LSHIKIKLKNNQIIMKNKNKKLINQIYLLLILIIIASMWILETSFSLAKELEAIASKHSMNENQKSHQKIKGEKHTVKVTAFSAKEYCAVPIIKKRIPDCSGKTYPENSIALNKKFGTQWEYVYIPYLKKRFKIIGTTDYKTDADIWFGENNQNAEKFGVKHLEIVLR